MTKKIKALLKTAGVMVGTLIAFVLSIFYYHIVGVILGGVFILGLLCALSFIIYEMFLED